MTYNIAVAGKGGVGKTSLTGLLIDTLVKTVSPREGCVLIPQRAEVSIPIGSSPTNCFQDNAAGRRS